MPNIPLFVCRIWTIFLVVQDFFHRIRISLLATINHCKSLFTTIYHYQPLSTRIPQSLQIAPSISHLDISSLWDYYLLLASIFTESRISWGSVRFGALHFSLHCTGEVFVAAGGREELLAAAEACAGKTQLEQGISGEFPGIFWGISRDFWGLNGIWDDVWWFNGIQWDLISGYFRGFHGIFGGFDDDSMGFSGIEWWLNGISVRLAKVDWIDWMALTILGSSIWMEYAWGF